MADGRSHQTRTVTTIHVDVHPRERPDDEALRILEREGSHGAAIAFAQARIDSHPFQSPSQVHWIRVAAILRRLQAGKKDGDRRMMPKPARAVVRDRRPAWPCAHQSGDFIAAFLAQARPGEQVAIRSLARGRLTYWIATVTGVCRGAGQVIVGARAFYIRSGRPIHPTEGASERLVTVTGAIRGFVADYPRGRDVLELRPPAPAG